MFVFLEDSDSFEQAKWQAQESLRIVADNSGLIGYKKTLAIANLRETFKSNGRPHSNEAMAAWFGVVNFADDAEKEAPTTPGLVGKHLRVYSRMSEVIMSRLDAVESLFGRRRPLSGLTSLDMTCACAANNRQPETATALLLWVVESIIVSCLRGHLDFGGAGRRALENLIPVFLAKRRIVMFFCSNFRYRESGADGSHYPEEFHAPKLLATLLNHAKWHHAFLRGDAFDPPTELPPTSWEESLPRSLQMILEALGKILDGQGDELLARFLAADARGGPAGEAGVRPKRHRGPGRHSGAVHPRALRLSGAGAPNSNQGLAPRPGGLLL